MSRSAGGAPEPAATIVEALDRLGRARRAQRRATAERLGLTPLQLDLLVVLAHGAPPDPVIGQLAVELAVSQPTVTDSVRALERKGLVARHRDPQDGRRTSVAPTPEGLVAVESAVGSEQEFVQAVAGLPPDRQEATLESLLSVIARLVDAGTITVARTCLTCHFHEPSGPTGHHCALLGQDLPVSRLRADCPDHRAA